MGLSIMDQEWGWAARDCSSYECTYLGGARAARAVKVRTVSQGAMGA